ncbi:MAG TPA: hypothetical protein VLD39_08710, partial [Gammaproteobacteria bacterium]|nr:hypothetical protein [Gammaproteobacteria bacterium]
MWEQVIRVWNHPLITLSDGAVITVNQIVLVVVLLTLGIFASRWIERAVGRRLRKAQMQADAVL